MSTTTVVSTQTLKTFGAHGCQRSLHTKAASEFVGRLAIPFLMPQILHETRTPLVPQTESSLRVITAQRRVTRNVGCSSQVSSKMWVFVPKVTSINSSSSRRQLPSFHRRKKFVCSLFPEPNSISPLGTCPSRAPYQAHRRCPQQCHACPSSSCVARGPISGSVYPGREAIKSPPWPEDPAPGCGSACERFRDIFSSRYVTARAHLVQP